MRKTTRYDNTGIRWQFSSFLEDRDFADHLEQERARYVKTAGLKISTAKAMMMRWNSPTGGNVQVDGEKFEGLSKFVYLGETVTEKGGSEENIRSRLGKATTAFNKLGNVAFD